MLKITVEIIPFGIEERKRILGTMTIANIKQNIHNISDYRVQMKDDNGDKEFVVKNFDRSKGFWKLIGKILRSKNV